MHRQKPQPALSAKTRIPHNWSTKQSQMMRFSVQQFIARRKTVGCYNVVPLCTVCLAATIHSDFFFSNCELLATTADKTIRVSNLMDSESIYIHN